MNKLNVYEAFFDSSVPTSILHPLHPLEVQEFESSDWFLQHFQDVLCILESERVEDSLPRLQKGNTTPAHIPYGARRLKAGIPNATQRLHSQLLAMFVASALVTFRVASPCS